MLLRTVLRTAWLVVVALLVSSAVVNLAVGVLCVRVPLRTPRGARRVLGAARDHGVDPERAASATGPQGGRSGRVHRA